MAPRERSLSWSEKAHVLGRMAMALCVGWGYLVLVIALDVGGFGSWLQASPYGLMVKVQLITLVGITFGSVGAHVGLDNVMGDALRAQRAVLVARREAMRRWRRH